MENPTNHFSWLYGQARKVVIFVVGSTVLLIGIAMIVLPGPAFIVIPIGLAILATEFVWARRWLDYAKQQVASRLNPQASEPEKKSDQEPKRE